MTTKHPVGVLNTSILTADGSYVLESITLNEARELVRGPEGFLSAVGHKSTSQILTELLGMEIPMNRVFFTQEPGQTALVFKLDGRPPEGVILTAEEVNEIGFSFKKLVRLV